MKSSLRLQPNKKKLTVDYLKLRNDANFFNYLIAQEMFAEAKQHEPVVEELTKTNEELQQELNTRPEADRLATNTTDATDGFAKSQADLGDLITRLKEYSDVAVKFTKCYEDLTEWLPIVKQQALKLKPISTHPDFIEEQLHETEVSVQDICDNNIHLNRYLQITLIVHLCSAITGTCFNTILKAHFYTPVI